MFVPPFRFRLRFGALVTSFGLDGDLCVTADERVGNNDDDDDDYGITTTEGNFGVDRFVIFIVIVMFRSMHSPHFCSTFSSA